jgi:XTP/dITP diphosphohydrolase
VSLTRGDLLIATRSQGKLRELRPLLERAGFTVVGLDEHGIEHEAAEDDLERFETFEENALAKARYFYEVSGGIATVADDSGLVIAALGGAPGVRSKRWSGRADLEGRALDEANNATLVAALAGVADRSAKYVCAAAFVGLDGELVRLGESGGVLLDAPRGGGGFGYDPYFASGELGGRTFAEAPRDEKERVSHRGRAFRRLLEALRDEAGG